jgi:two-component system OmpR family sensor kinase
LLGLVAWAALPAGLALPRALAGAWGWVVRALLAESPGAQRLREAEAAARRDRSRAEAADRSRRALVVNASHELRTPVAAISAHLESLLMATEAGESGALHPDELRAQLGVAYRESERLGSLVDDLLVLARADADELRLDIASVAAGDVMAEVCEALRPLAWCERQVTLVHDVPAGMPPVCADRQRLGQVLENLVRNAVTHTPPGGIVSLSLSPGAPGFLALSVADTGSGMAPEEVERIFERFYRTDAARARGAGGFGLGLAIVQDLVRAMGGRISVASTPGQGSTFRLELPLAGGPDR